MIRAFSQAVHIRYSSSKRTKLYTGQRKKNEREMRKIEIKRKVCRQGERGREKKERERKTERKKEGGPYA